ncbi:hypothetical protein EVAR_61673_1 [Eumeta japonica]|uniref:Uncharacterized protein n=1 Tax=Eumeta variegata TaxID=151549 RepID=A0A4C1YQ12_EUMVA|nr:hypothetical protein EVAR_61673_1 [Eumeta japonica]
MHEHLLVRDAAPSGLSGYVLDIQRDHDSSSYSHNYSATVLMPCGTVVCIEPLYKRNYLRKYADTQKPRPRPQRRSCGQ